jgi:hypothetical protein
MRWIAGIGLDLDDDGPKNPRYGILAGALLPMSMTGYLAALCHPRQCALHPRRLEPSGAATLANA